MRSERSWLRTRIKCARSIRRSASTPLVTTEISFRRISAIVCCSLSSSIRLASDPPLVPLDSAIQRSTSWRIAPPFWRQSHCSCNVVCDFRVGLVDPNAIVL
ncbi:hypothetical protein HD806DRAFT_120432 [Xylariaceae sp. AK1471]|nr:hypothetical protein HD806DRAFT_120432 [Xylariaceae sp. AK1471]